MVEWGVEGKNALYPISGLRDVRCPLKGGVVTTCTVQWAHSEPYSIVSEPARFCHNLLASHSRAELRQPHIPRWRSQLHIKAGISCRTQRLALVSCLWTFVWSLRQNHKPNDVCCERNLPQPPAQRHKLRQSFTVYWQYHQLGFVAKS